MNKSFIEKEISINASPDKVWRVFTDPDVTRQMGGEYVSEWEIGSSFGWKGSDGKMQTNGRIIQLETEKLLKHDLFSSVDTTAVTSVITYRLGNMNGNTLLFAHEDLVHDMTDKEYEEASEGWDAALHAVKQIAEKLTK